MHPNLGVVSLEPGRSFVIADIPGLIEGAAEGAGLGHQFLKHLQRTGLLLHLVEVQPIDGTDPVEQIKALEHELERFDPELLAKPRWLVITKTDQLAGPELRDATDRIVADMGWQGPWFAISSVSGAGLKPLVSRIAGELERT